MSKPKLRTIRRLRNKALTCNKLKSHSASKKRFKITATGLILGSHTHMQKNKRRKSPNQRAHLRHIRVLSKGHARLMKKGHRAISL